MTAQHPSKLKVNEQFATIYFHEMTYLEWNWINMSKLDNWVNLVLKVI